MKITKYFHSCLLVEENNTTVLFDPGLYTFQEKAFPLESVTKLDYIAITHEHQDHLDIPFLKLLLKKFPQARVFSNPSVHQLLIKERIGVETTDNQLLKKLPMPHEKLMGNSPVAENSGIMAFGKLLHAGDSLHFTSSPQILALPVTAPWGSMVQAVDAAVQIKPKYIIPIHDYHWKDEARKQFYQWMQGYFQSQVIAFLPIESGSTLTI